MHVLTYALGAGADTSVTKRLACDSRGISHVIDDTSGDKLANAMANYFRLLSPMLEPCQTRWVTYEDWLSGTELLGACMAAYEKVGGGTSCEGGLDGLGESGDGRTPTLLGVSCIDMNLVVSLETIRNRPDWGDFDARMRSDAQKCPRVTLTELQARSRSLPPAPRLHLACTSPASRLHLACISPASELHLARLSPQLETLRLGVSESAVCGDVAAVTGGADSGSRAVSH